MSDLVYWIGVRAGLTSLGLLLCPIASAYPQVIEARIGRFYDSPGWTAYRAGFTRELGSGFAAQVHGDYLRQASDGGVLAGLGADLTVFRTGGEGPYLVAGLSGGLGSERSNDLSNLWGSWSAGAGYDLFLLSFLSVGVEGRWRQLSLARRNGLELAIGLGIHTRSGPATPLPAVPLSPSLASTPQGLADSIIATATEAMGRPYEYGGTGAPGEGFDCSGLIQFAFGKHGIKLPRRSLDQAREGKKVPRRLRDLAPADILTFSNRGGGVTHVGLYIGNGRFIHSATRGVQISVLSPEDPYGRWWYKRWVGVRRIVP